MNWASTKTVVGASRLVRVAHLYPSVHRVATYSTRTGQTMVARVSMTVCEVSVTVRAVAGVLAMSGMEVKEAALEQKSCQETTTHKELWMG